MAVDLADHVGTLRREITPLGSTLFANVTDTTLAGHMADGFWEARLDGFLKAWTSDPDGVVTPVESGGPDLPRDLVALVILYASIKILRNHILSLANQFRAVAGPVEFETKNAASVLTAMLEGLQSVKSRLLTSSGDRPRMDILIDGFSARQGSIDAYAGGLYDYLTGSSVGS